ncbi:hypothetical protein JJV70_01915 [Streptomyces sp. JJ66]|uniref:hypothetical protein n=1 Tax=Streptomyces sp. JJ66 TaxID=2803843 RepID=UPI001C58BE32|nr:hypothetical protein [Streptomyces sp. JJ66]MBW1600876.1 hypothetical protein [Streptomyces sp. JJ66]
MSFEAEQLQHALAALRDGDHHTAQQAIDHLIHEGHDGTAEEALRQLDRKEPR